MHPGRKERRMTTGIPARLERPEVLSIDDTASIENISTHGARVSSDRPWRTDERLLLSSSRWGLHTTAARVVYCLPGSGRRFMVGLEFAEPRALPDSV
jgi:hypothetical protein